MRAGPGRCSANYASVAESDGKHDEVDEHDDDNDGDGGDGDGHDEEQD